MDQLHLLFLLSFSMLIGSFFSGTVPMAFKLSDTKSRLLALLGSGILVGTALSIIIPEGIDSIYASPIPDDPKIKTDSSIYDHKNDSETSNKQQVETWVIGVSLVAGFVLMLFIDQFSLYRSGPEEGDGLNSDGHNLHHDYALANQDDDMEIVFDRAHCDTNQINETDEISSETRPIRDADTSHHVTMRALGSPDSDSRIYSRNSSHIDNHSHYSISKTKVTPTLGLVIHAAADGIALGAAATTSHRQVEMIIFLAIMLHKAPAAFSLVIFLLHRGFKHSTIRKHLLAFSLSAPIAALSTYFGLSQSGKEALRRNNATGIAMLFSAGTFLYVATVHVLPELVHNKLLSPKELIFLVGGAFLPVLLAQTI